MPTMAYQRPKAAKATKPSAVSRDPQDPQLDDEDLRHEILTRFKFATDHVKDWNDVAKHDYAFAMGEQWNEEELQQLREQGRPAFTFNRIKNIINLISGYQRENSARIKVNPEGGEDQLFSQVLDRAFVQVDKWSHLDYKMAYWFDDGLRAGQAWLEAVLTYEADPIRGELRFQTRSPYQIIVDPEHSEYDLNEWPRAAYVFKIVRLTRDQLKELYPGKDHLFDGFQKDADDDEARILNGSGLLVEGDQDDYGNRPNVTTRVRGANGSPMEESGLTRDEKFTVKEYWCPALVEKSFVIEAESGEPRRFDSKDEADVFVVQQKFGSPVARKVGEMRLSALVGGHLVQSKEKSPFEPHYHGYPFFRFLSDWSPNAETQEARVQGIVRPLKDCQREKNKAKSQYLHILSTQANSGWVGDKDALTDQGWKQLKNLGGTPGVTIKKKRGAELREILPKGPNAGHIRLEEKADDEFKQISGINPDLLGMQEGETASGKAISLRIKQSVLSLARIFYNYRYSKEILGRFVLEMMPGLFDTKKLKKLLGPDFIAKSADKARYPEGVTDGVLEAFLQMVKDHKYDISVTETGHNATMRFEIAQTLSELIKAGAPIPVSMLVDYMDLPNAQEAKDAIAAEQQRLAAAEAAKGAGA